MGAWKRPSRERLDMRIDFGFKMLAVAAVSLIAVGCISSGSNQEEPVATAPPVSAPTESATAVPSSAPTRWNCGEVKHRVLDLVERLEQLSSEAEAAVAEEGFGGDAESLLTDLTRELAGLNGGFSSDDQVAMNFACQLQGQHAAAVELWAAGDRGDACDVWKPTAVEASAAERQVDIANLHPVVSRVWAVATGEVAEGNGRCLAEAAN